MRGLVILVAVSGCNQIYGLEPTRLEVPADGPGCSDGQFVGPTPLPDLVPDLPEYQPQVRHDLREVWFQVGASGPDTGIYVARRASASDPWGPGLQAFRMSDEESPALSGDGKRLVFSSSYTGAKLLYEAKRASIEDDFGPPTELAGVGSQIYTFDLSFDGKTVYFTEYGDDTSTLWEVSRPDFTKPFDPVTKKAIATGVTYISVSPDGLELFYDPPDAGQQVWRQTRSTTAEMFNTPAQRLDTAEDPDLAGNGTTLYVSRNGGLAELVRPCPRQ